MKNKEESGPIGKIENLAGNTREYIDMRIDSLKLKMVESLSILFSRILYAIILVLLLGSAFAFLAAAFSSWMSEITGSPIIGPLITASLFLIIALILFIKRKRFFVNRMVELFISLFFNSGENNTEE